MTHATPRHPSGSVANATAKIVTLERYAVMLDEAATAARWRRILGRPDLRLQRVAQDARDLARLFRRWHDPGEWEEARESTEDRAADCEAYLDVVRRAKALGVSIT